MKCAMEICTCVAEPGKAYCSAACASNSKNERGQCGCGHAACRPRAEQRLLGT